MQSTNHHSSRATVIQMHGEPGSGKSTIARALAPRIDAIALDKDVIKAALLRVGIDEGQAAPAAYEVFFAQARALTSARQSIILDNPVYWASVEAHWLDISAAAGCPPILIECVCANRDEIRRRLATRPALESQPRDPLDLRRHPGSSPTAFRPRLVLDTTLPLPSLLDAAVSYIEAAILAPRPATGHRQPATHP